MGPMSTEIQQSQRVSDTTWNKALAKSGEQGAIDLLGINGYYSFLAMTLNAARTALPQV